jgi:hypothetical protein
LLTRHFAPRLAGAAAVLSCSATLAAAAARADEAFLVAGPPGVRALRDAVERGGGAVRAVLPGGCVTADVDGALAARLLEAGLARRVARGPFDASALAPAARLGAAAFSLRAAGMADGGRGAPAGEPAPDGGLPDALPSPLAPGSGVTGGEPVLPMTAYLAGDVAVAIVFLESDGSGDPDTESWSDAARAGALAEIQSGLDWLAGEAQAIENARVVWVYDLATAATPAEAVTRQAQDGVTGPDAAVQGALTSLGFAASAQGAADYARAVRARLGTDHAALIFVAPAARAISQGSPGIRAYAYLGGPYAVMGYPGFIGRSLALTAPHELSHLFDAADEYGSGASPADRRGYLAVANGNYRGPNGTGLIDEACYMRDLSHEICAYSAGEVGLLLPGAAPDGTPDALQYEPGGVTRRDQVSVRRVLAFDDGRAGSNGNADYRPDPGERVALAVDLGDDAYTALHDVTATLAGGGAVATVAKGTARFGDIAARGAARNLDDLFLVDIAPGAAAGASAAFDLAVTCAEGWTLHAPLALVVGGGPRDGASLVIDIDSPLSSSLATREPAVTVAGRTNDPRVSAVTIGGVPAQVAAGAFRAAVALADGAQSLAIEARVDATGEVARASITALRDERPPAVTILEPADGIAVPGPTVRVAGRVDEPGIASICVAGTAVAVRNGAFTAVVPLEAGPNAIEAVARDAAGNEGRAAVSVVAAEGFSVPALAAASGGGGGGGCQAGGGSMGGEGVLVALALACIAAARLLEVATGGGAAGGRRRS